jgi:tetratricopeptide (TPR) repeat protein
MAPASSLPPVSPEHRRIAAEQFERARQVLTSGSNHDYAIQLLLACCKLDPANLIYRKELRRTQKARFKNNLRGSRLAFLTTAGHRAKLKNAKRTRDHAKVLAHGEDILTRNPWDTGAQMDMADAADALGLVEVAVFILTEARQKNAKDATVNRALARLLEKAGHFSEAIKLWELVRQAHPADVEAQHKAKDLAASETIARGHYQEAVHADAPVRAFQTAQKSSAEHKKLEVEAALQQQLETEPTEPGPYLELAARHRKAGKPEQALEVLHKGLAATGNDFRLAIEVAELELEPFRKNLQLTEDKLKATPDDEELRRIRIRLLKEINTRETDLYRLKADRFPNDLSFRLELGIRLLRAGQTEAAIAELQQARKDPKLTWKALTYLGHCFKGRNNWRLAERNFEEALKNLPASEEATKKEVLFQLAQGSADAGDLAKAVEFAHELANLDFAYRDIGRLLDEWQERMQKA